MLICWSFFSVIFRIRRAPNPVEQQMQQQPSMMMPIPMGGNPMTHLPSMMGPPPPPPPHHNMPPPPHPHHHSGPIPLAMIARINADIDNQLQLQEQQQIEEHIIPIFQQLLPELRQSQDNGGEHQQQQQQHQKQMMEAEDRAMPNKVLYHPAMAEGRSLYTVAISDKPNGGGNGGGDEGPIMHQQVMPSETRNHHAPMFQRVPIHVPVMIPPPGAGPMVQQQQEPIDEPKQDHRPHCK